MSIRRSLSSLDQESAQSNLPKSDLVYKTKKGRLREVTLSFLQTIKEHYIVTVDYRTNSVSNCFPRYDDTILGYVAKLVKKVKSQNEGAFLCLGSSDPHNWILATFKLACDTNNIYNGEAMRSLPNYIRETLATTLDSRMCAQDRRTLLATSVRNQQPRSHKLLRS